MRRGFSPTERFADEKREGSKSPDVEREDEKPQVVGTDGKPIEPKNEQEEEDSYLISGHTGQMKSGGNEMDRNLDAAYKRFHSNPSKVAEKLPTTG